jgi:acylphosphatase
VFGAAVALAIVEFPPIMPAGRKSVRVRIEGRVQGVGFRAWVAIRAQAFGLFGWVANRRDGGVEAVLSGDPCQVDELVAMCHEGPPGGHVAWVAVHDEPDCACDGFSIRPTR